MVYFVYVYSSTVLLIIIFFSNCLKIHTKLLCIKIYFFELPHINASTLQGDVVDEVLTSSTVPIVFLYNIRDKYNIFLSTALVKSVPKQIHCNNCPNDTLKGYIQPLTILILYFKCWHIRRFSVICTFIYV